MKIGYLKTQLEIITGTSVAKVYFDRNHILNTDRDKSYPYVFWDLNSYKSVMSWTSTARQKESVTMRAYCVGYLDKDYLPRSSDSLEAMYDTLRDAFRSYLGVVNSNAYINVTNMEDMNNELFPYGFSIDAEVAVSFDVEMKLYCNV